MPFYESKRNDLPILQACFIRHKSGQLAGFFISTTSKRRSCPSGAPEGAAFTLRHVSITRPLTVNGSQVGLLYCTISLVLHHQYGTAPSVWYCNISLAELNRLTLSLAEAALLATVRASIFRMKSRNASFRVWLPLAKTTSC